MSTSDETIDVGAEFFSHILTNIPNLNVEELADLEDQLAREFRLISKNYISSRLSRINKLIERINSSIKIATANDRNWSRIYNFEIETINNIKTNTEDVILMSMSEIDDKPDILKSLDEYEEELAEIIKNLQSPLAFDDTLGQVDNDAAANKINDNDIPNENNDNKTTTTSTSITTTPNSKPTKGKLGTSNNNNNTTNNENDPSKLPFPYLFDKFFKPHKQSLKTIVNEKRYQSKLILDNSLGNSTIIWKSYYNDLIKRKQTLVQQTYDELNNLYKEYHHVNYNEVSQRQWKHYYRSILNPQDVKVPSEEGFIYGRPPTPLVDTSNTSNVKDIVAANRDTNYANLDNQLIQKNKYELTQLKRKIVNANKDFESIQASNGGQSSKKRIRLNNFTGLTRDEIDQDIQLLRKETKKLNNGRGSTAPNENSQSVAASETEFDYDRDDEDEEGRKYNDEEDEEDEEEEREANNEEQEDNEVTVKSEPTTESVNEESLDPEVREKQRLRRKYKQLLGLESSLISSSFRIPVLPPLENFPDASTVSRN
ncbi:hypothetical protein DFJ63DRAFT_335683 [Scheffersomyces coipomensis]|uniref:uncharacterized protein n=1 Tax=Scheffersomyces coipomensis TaxID=1788519 RepID=UPI00315D9780